jgi:predicted nuclease of restriction endonuclease-like (RecB) superfamily
MMSRCSADITRANIKAAQSLSSIGIDFVCIPVSSLASKKELVIQFCEAMESLAADQEENEAIAENQKFLSELE